MPRSNIVIYQYKKASESAHRLIRNLEHILDQDVSGVISDSNFTPKPDDFIVGWGSGHRPDWKIGKVRYINKYDAICQSVDKRLSFKNFVDYKVPIPPFTLKASEANKWLAEGLVVLSRTEIEGMKGQGIEINHPDIDDVVKPAPLYTQFIRKDREIRLHVFKDKVIFGQEKILRQPSQTIKKLVLREGSAWDFEWLGPDERKALGTLTLDAAVSAIRANGLDFGAVDLLITKDKQPFVLETNTCPELGRDGAARYANAIIAEEKATRA